MYDFQAWSDTFEIQVDKIKQMFSLHMQEYTARPIWRYYRAAECKIKVTLMELFATSQTIILTLLSKCGAVSKLGKIDLKPCRSQHVVTKNRTNQ